MKLTKKGRIVKCRNLLINVQHDLKVTIDELNKLLDMEDEELDRVSLMKGDKPPEINKAIEKS